MGAVRVCERFVAVAVVAVQLDNSTALWSERLQVRRSQGEALVELPPAGGTIAPAGMVPPAHHAHFMLPSAPLEAPLPLLAPARPPA